MKRGLLKKTISMVIATALIFTSGSFGAITKVSAATEKPDFGVGKGVKWPEHYCAPYVDLCNYHTQEGFNIAGAPYMPKFTEDTGLRYFNVAFIQAASPTLVDGKIKWGWGGYNVLSEPSDDEQYLGMKQSIRDLRAMGGDITLSFGGRDGVAVWQVTKEVEPLYEMYKEIVEGYGLTRMDLDIEEGGQKPEDNYSNAKAIKMLQDATGVDVTLTVPVLPSGLTETQTKILEIYLSAGVDISLVNIMAMCYGTNALLPGENYGTGSVRAIDSTMKQIQEYYKKYTGVILTEEEAYKKIGVTTSVGFESKSDPIFPPEWSKLVADHAIEKGIGMTSMWSLNRDAMLDTNEGITGMYEHTKEYIRHGTTEVIKNNKPEISGVNDKKVKLGQAFNPLNGVRVTDFEDGILTDSIKVSGQVNTNAVGDYKLTYSVTDNGGLTTTVDRTITVTNEDVINEAPALIGVEDKTLVSGGYFNPYFQVKAQDKEDGDITYKVKANSTVDTTKPGKYLVNYSVTDSDGKITSVDTIVKIIDPKEYIEEFDFYKVYYGGEIVRYKGKTYICTGWSTYEYPDEEWSYSWKPYEAPEEETSIDLATAAMKYNIQKGEANYDSNYDLNADGIIDIYDLVLIASKM